MDVDDVELAYGRGGLARGSFSSLDAPDPIDESEGGEGGEGASHGQASARKPSMTQQELVGRRLGQSSGKVRGAAEVVPDPNPNPTLTKLTLTLTLTRCVGRPRSSLSCSSSPSCSRCGRSG